MTENRVSFLCNIALNLSPKNDTYKVLKSFYLLRCNEVAKGYGLPRKYFSSVVRCPHCYSDWTRDSYVKTQPVKLNKSQQQRKKSRKKSKHGLNNSQQRKHILRNEMVQICSFCKQSTTTQHTKPESLYKTSQNKDNVPKAKNHKQGKKKGINKIQSNKNNTKSKVDKKENIVNVYTKAFDVFSLKNEKNTLTNTIKEAPKIIKNNKKRKDKFAGLCAKAVLASAILKTQKEQEQVKQTKQLPHNKLNLFLKPSSG